MNAESAAIAVHSTGVQAIGLALFGILGIPLNAIVWGLIGAYGGSVVTRPIRDTEGAILYMCASLLSGLAGYTISRMWFNGEAVLTNLFSGVLGFLFNAISASVIAVVPTMVQTVASVVTSRFKTESKNKEGQ